MNDTEMALLRSVKTAVARYGLEGVSTRNVSEISHTNAGLIYHYFEDKQALLRNAYKLESNAIFDAILQNIDEVRDIPFTFPDKLRLCFHRTWRLLLADTERLIFVTGYYHSKYFYDSRECHENQVKGLTERLGYLFPDAKACVTAMYSVMSLIYEYTMRIATRLEEDTSEAEETAYRICAAVMQAQMRQNA